MEQNKANVWEVEQKYDHLKLQEENQRLKNIRLRYQFYIISLLGFSIIGYLIFYFYRKETKQKIQWQEEQVSRLDKERAQIVSQLEEAKQALTVLENNNKEERLCAQAKIAFLTEQYQHLQEQRLKSSSVYKKLVALCGKKQPGSDKVLLNNKMWVALSAEINAVFPHFHTSLFEQCPHLTEDEWRYCYLHILGFDSNDEAILLGIQPTSVLVKRNRIKQKLATVVQKENKLYNILAHYCRN